MNNFWKGMVLMSSLLSVSLLVTFLYGMSIFLGHSEDISDLKARVAELEGRVTELEAQVDGLQERDYNLESRVFGLEKGIQDLCRTLVNMSWTDDALVTLADSEDVFRIEETYNRIHTSRAYCQDTVAIYVDVRQSEGLRVRIINAGVAQFLVGSWWEGLDPTISLLDAEGNVLVTLDPSPYFRRGDFMRVWISDEEPSFAGFYDPTTGLSVSIKHLDGSFEPSITR